MCETKHADGVCIAKYGLTISTYESKLNSLLNPDQLPPYPVFKPNRRLTEHNLFNRDAGERKNDGTLPP